MANGARIEIVRRAQAKGMMATMRKPVALVLAALLLAAAPARAQYVGGNVSLSVSASSANVALPANTQSYPSVILAPAYGSTAEIFYALGGSSVTAVSGTSPALPSGGICINLGPSAYVAAVSASAQTLRITQLNTCANFNGGNGGGAAPYGFSPLSPGQHNLGITTSTALTVPSGATYATVCDSGAAANYTTDGTTTPTSTVGQPIAVGQCVALSGPLVLKNFLAIQTTATATLNVEYFK